eukprot:CAMPEP_0172323050 /NCGR_PEP_ID=MMETSP1058-20130122/47742_1 /TAXON_ID=83371 /ORGANISM="Detonula confervacea, Strain CCMP 353" /LENGTH=290 /DNA_ID=CAMNT_0013038965 /DNA_START=135 /DNA_END=1007 /DNA_ORIENTATION=-
MSILAVTATKPRADSRLGFKYERVVNTSIIIVTAVNEHGLFSGTDLKRGQEIISINGTRPQNLERGTMGAFLALLPTGNVTFIVKSKIPPNDGVIFKCTAIPDRSGSQIHGTRMETGIDDMPKILKDASVPREKWLLIYTLISDELMPVSFKCVKSNETYNRDMHLYLRLKRSNHTDATLEKAVHMKGVQTGILHNNVTIVAMAVKDRVNSMLAKHHIMAVLAYESIRLPQYPTEKQSTNQMMIAVGFNFYSMDYLTVCAIPTVPGIILSAPAIAVPVVPTAPELVTDEW